MSCCGKNRESLRRSARQVKDSTPSTPAAGPAHSMPSPREVYFEYTGASNLTVIGPITRSRYSFAHPGAVVAVDSRDAPSVAAVPGLRGRRDGGVFAG